MRAWTCLLVVLLGASCERPAARREADGAAPAADAQLPADDDGCAEGACAPLPEEARMSQPLTTLGARPALDAAPPAEVATATFGLG